MFILFPNYYGLGNSIRVLGSCMDLTAGCFQLRVCAYMCIPGLPIRIVPFLHVLPLVRQWPVLCRGPENTSYGTLYILCPHKCNRGGYKRCFTSPSPL